MTGFRGQKFDFTGVDGAWYSVLDDGPALRLNMRGEVWAFRSIPVPVPVPTSCGPFALSRTTNRGELF